MSTPMLSVPSRKRQRRALQQDPSLFGRFTSYISTSLGLAKDIKDEDLNDFLEERDEHGKRRRIPEERVLVERENREPKRPRTGSPGLSAKLQPRPAPSQPPPKAPVLPLLPTTVPATANSLAFSSISLADDRASQPISSPSRSFFPPNPYRLRMSVTPQPVALSSPAKEVAHAEKSASDKFNDKPTPGLRPSTEAPERVRGESRPPVETTLGMLVESRRKTASPARQRSLLVVDSPRVSPAIAGPRKLTPAERALQGLDAYKTSILPARPSAPPEDEFTPSSSQFYDMFSRRTRRLELLKGERDKRRLENIGKPDVDQISAKPGPSPRNDTKPYAGSGGLRKLLERRQKEEAEGEKTIPVPKQDELKGMTTSSYSSSQKSAPPASSSNKDWHAATSRATSHASSLRVGRTKVSRVHLSRPGKASNRFSAADGDDGDDEQEEDRRRKEEEELNSFAQKAPTFHIPKGFTFAQNAAPALPAELDDAKDTPIPALPFSFGAPQVDASKDDKGKTGADKASLGVPVISVEAPKPTNTEKQPSLVESAPAAVPNFFASSPALKAPGVPALAMPNISESTVTSEPMSAKGPILDVDSPFWDKSTAQPEAVKPNLFSGLRSKDTVQPVSSPLFASKGPDPPATTPAPSLFNFGAAERKPSEDTGLKSLTSATPKPDAVSISSPKAETSTENPVIAGTQEPSATPAATPVFTFGVTSSPVVASTTPLGSPSKPAAPSETAFTHFPSTTPAGTPPSGQPKAIFSGIEASTPKSLFGPLATAEKKTEEPKSVITPAFTFGATPPTAVPVVPSTTLFASSPASTTPTATPAPFSFGTPAQGEPKPLAFAQPSSRPVTPPKEPSRDELMDESPARETTRSQPESRPSLITPAFSFGGTNTLFSQPPIQQSTSGPAAFSFGVSPSPATTSFGASFPEPKRDSSPFAFGSTVAPPTLTRTSSFGPESSESQRPNTAGSFSFTANAPPAASTPAPFTFSSSQQGTSPFAGQAGSAPSSPSTFGSNVFSFGANQSTAAANPFQFGSSSSTSQATESSASSSTFAFASGQSNQTAASFTVGAAPPPAPPGARPRKGLPRRKR